MRGIPPLYREGCINRWALDELEYLYGNKANGYDRYIPKLPQVKDVAVLSC